MLGSTNGNVSKVAVFDIDKTRKHFVPRNYLRGFSRDGHPNQIYVFDKQHPDQGAQPRSINDVEVARDAYSVANDLLLTDFESAFSSILESVRGSDVDGLNEFISDLERSSSLRAWLSRFVVDICLRSRGFRDSPTVRGLIEEGFAEARRQFDEFESKLFLECPDHDQGMLNRIASALRESSHLDDIDEWSAVTLDPFVRGDPGAEWYAYYQTGSWRFDAVIADRRFITSDIPSTTFRLGPEPELYGCVWFTVPLSGRLQLMGLLGDAWCSVGWSEGSVAESGLAAKLGQWGDREIDLANGAVFRNAQRYVYASEQSEILRAVELQRSGA